MPIRVDGKILSVKEIFNQIKQVMTLGLNEEVNKDLIGVLSSQNRLIWADVRTKFQNLSEINKKSLDDIETCNFLICIEVYYMIK